MDADPELHNTPIIFLTALVTKPEIKGGLDIQGMHFSRSRSVFPS
jgi:hypothetical protein